MRSVPLVARAPEDAAHAVRVLRIRPGDRVLLAAAGADDAIAHATAGAEVSLSHPDAYELARIRLLRAAAEVPYDQFCSIVGLSRADPAAWRSLPLSRDDRALWAAHPDVERGGLLRHGALDRGLAVAGASLRRERPDLTERIRTAGDLDAQRRLVRELFTYAWRARFVVATSRRFHRWSQRSGRAQLQSFARTLHHHLARDDRFHHFWVGGPDPTPFWATPAGHAGLAQALDRVALHPTDATTTAAAAPSGRWTALHVSGTWGGVPDGPRLLATFNRAGARRARILWWASRDEEPTWPSALVDKVVPGRILPQHEADDHSWVHGGIRLADLA